MPRYNAPFEIHVHGDIPLQPHVSWQEVQEALQPMWQYAGARSLAEAAQGVYDEEPGIRFDERDHVLRMCWTTPGDEDFRESLSDVCMNLNELSSTGSHLEITFYDHEFDEEQEGADREEDSRDDFVMLFIGPTPAAIMQVQRDLLVQDVVHLMERHFDPEELVGVVAEVDKLFTQRFDNLIGSLEISKPPRPRGSHGARHTH